MLPGFKPTICLIPNIRRHPGNLYCTLIGGVSFVEDDAIEYAKQIMRAVKENRQKRKEAAARTVFDAKDF